MLKWILRNKYKLLIFMVVLYVVVDVMRHKGLTRTLLPKNFPSYKIDSGLPKNANTVINNNKKWAKAANTIEEMNKVDEKRGGVECDVYFDMEKKIFDVHHEEGASIGLSLDGLLDVYKKRQLQLSIWLDFKNLNDSNCNPAVAALVSIRDKYGLANKLIVESVRPTLLTPFSDSGFYTSYYAPMFNPYLISDDEIKQWVDTLSSEISRSKVNAISGYYFQCSFLQHYFPNYPILTWVSDYSYSLIDWLSKRKITGNKEIFIILQP